MAEYKDIDFLDPKKNVRLTRNTETGHIYVKKYISAEQYKIYEYIRKKRYQGIPIIADIYPEDDYYVLIEEYIRGYSLQQRLDRGESFSAHFVYKLAVFLCRTLLPVHKDKIIHRDITASNIICTEDERFYLIDFGNARTYKREQSVDTEFIGTPNYAAPEQFGFGQSDLRTDIYAIGTLMNVLLTGGRFIHEEKYKGKLGNVIKKCTAVNTKSRYKNVSNLRVALFLSMHRPFTSIPVLLLCLCVAAVIALIAIPYSADHSKIDYSDLIKAPATSEPMEKAYRRWSDIENCIRDSNFDEAQKRLDEAVEEGLNGWNVYRLYSENYEAQGKYDDAAEAIIYYVYNVWGTENITKESLVYVRLEYLYPNCSEEVKVKIDEIMSL